MNWVAHVFLSKSCVHFQLGNLIADFVKGKTWPGIHPSTEAGLHMHRTIDAFTDSHPVVRRSQQRLRERGYLRAVVIDLSYDHMLIKNWERTHSTTPARTFLNKFYHEAEQVLDSYPAEIKQFMKRIIEADTLGRYAEVHGIQRGMRKVDRRLSERVLRKERATDYFNDVLREYSALEQDFLEFFPALQAHVVRSINAS